MTLPTRFGFKRFAALVLGAVALSGALAGAASAQVFQVRDIAINQTAANTQQAVIEGRAAARRIAAERLINRLTLPEDRAAAQPAIDLNQLATAGFARSVDTQQDGKQTATSYIAVLAVNFNDKAVRDYLDQRKVPFVETQAAKALIAPAAIGFSPDTWAAVWKGRNETTLLTPYVASDEAWDRRPGWEDVRGEIAAKGANYALVAEATLRGGQYFVTMVDLRTGSPESANITVGPYPTPETARDGALAELENAWKRASIVRTTGSTELSLVASFKDVTQWVKIRKGLETSRIISNLRVESVSATGADLAFAYAGRPDQLAADLRAKGLDLRNQGRDWVIEASAQQ